MPPEVIAVEVRVDDDERDLPLIHAMSSRAAYRGRYEEAIRAREGETGP